MDEIPLTPPLAALALFFCGVAERFESLSGGCALTPAMTVLAASSPKEGRAPAVDDTNVQAQACQESS